MGQVISICKALDKKHEDLHCLYSVFSNQICYLLDEMDYVVDLIELGGREPWLVEMLDELKSKYITCKQELHRVKVDISNTTKQLSYNGKIINNNEV